MKRHLYYIAGALLALASCSEASREMFHAPDGVYFRMPAGDTTLITRADTIVYSFAFDFTATRREICIPVEIVGFAASTDRTYRVQITNHGDAREGLHYDAVNPVQTIRAGKTRDSLRVTFSRTPDMQRAAKKIGITILPGGDLPGGVRERMHVAVQVSDVLEKPSWWDKWNGKFGGAYDPQIYKAWMGIWGGKGDLSAYTQPNWWGAPQVLTAIIDLKTYFEAHETYYLDRPTVRIIIPYPS
ncbi:MAG: DUF4843 domain-containing protein [Odoribacteraceae bacterium]|jgi:hypothetical protein|nr:DUF4843 domain-containing protein [Odoribacteraceae bacterium]